MEFPEYMKGNFLAKRKHLKVVELPQISHDTFRYSN